MAAFADLNPCVRIILCGLSNAVLLAIRGLITAQIAFVEAQIVTFEAQVAKYDLLAKAAQAAANIAVAEIQQIKAQASLIPLALISNCTPLGDLNLAFQQTIDATTATIESLVADATRILSFMDELNLAIAQLRQVADLYNAVLQVISTCSQ